MSQYLSLSSSQLVETADEQEGESGFSWLPKELIGLILGHLEIHDACAAFSACRSFARLSRTMPYIWERVYKNTFGSCFVRESFVDIFGSKELPSANEYALGSGCLKQAIAEFPPFPWRFLCVSWFLAAKVDDANETEDEDQDSNGEQEEFQMRKSTELNIKSGIARFEDEHGQIFVGFWLDGEISLGLCCSLKADSCLKTDAYSFSYAGEFQNRRGHGLGVTKFPSGGVFRGNFAHGELQGKGKLMYTEGDSYDGDWERNTKSGIGLYSWISGNVYRYEFQNFELRF